MSLWVIVVTFDLSGGRGGGCGSQLLHALNLGVLFYDRTHVFAFFYGSFYVELFSA